MAHQVEANSPDLWRSELPIPGEGDHKYHRGYVAIYGAPELTGATRLAAQACNRVGAGLVNVIADANADLYRICLPPDIMVTSQRPAKATVALGGSGGISKLHRKALFEAVGLTARILDADALTADIDWAQLGGNCILTPHRGEFERLFGPVGDDPVDAALSAARCSGAIVVFKAPKTVIASPEGKAIINHHASPYLAKAGTGDVLAGLIAGLVAQGMPALGACCAAVWMHGEAAIRFGPGLIASDIPEMMPAILRDLLDPA